MNILITGATGAIGQNFVHQLVKNSKIRLTALVRNLQSAKHLLPKEVSLIPGDITQKHTLHRATKNQHKIFHLVGIGNLTDNSPQASRLFHRVNVTGTQNLLEACVQNRVNQIVYLSSLAAQGLIVGRVVTETTPPNPQTAYEKSKYQSEKVIQLFRNHHRLRITLIRPAQVYGPGMPNTDLKLLARFTRLPLFPVIGSGNNQLPLVYVSDLVQVLLRLSALSSLPDQDFNLVREDGITYRGLIHALQSSLKSPSRLIHLSPSLAKLAAALGFGWFPLLGLTPPLTPARIGSITADRRYNVSKAQKLLHFRSTPFQDSINHTVLSWKP